MKEKFLEKKESETGLWILFLPCDFSAWFWK